jgi:riboflavin transporter FmnP
MNSKGIGTVIAFTSLTTTLNFVRVPVPYMPAFSYQLGDIVLVVALLLFGIRIAIAAATLNMLINIVLSSSPAGPIGPPYYLLSVLAMFSGVYIFEKLIKRRIFGNRNIIKTASLATGFGVLTRVLIMLPFDYFVYGFLVSLVSNLSISVSYAIVLASMPGIIIYNITVPIIMIPISYSIAKNVSKYRVSKSDSNLC